MPFPIYWHTIKLLSTLILKFQKFYNTKFQLPSFSNRPLPNLKLYFLSNILTLHSLRLRNLQDFVKFVISFLLKFHVLELAAGAKVNFLVWPKPCSRIFFFTWKTLMKMGMMGIYGKYNWEYKFQNERKENLTKFWKYWEQC